MMEIHRVEDILGAASSEAMMMFGDNLTALILYGSFSFRNMKEEAIEFDHPHQRRGLDGFLGKFFKKQEKGFLDSKPDLLPVVRNLKEGLNSVGERYGWDSETLDNLMMMDQNSPFYFNIETKKALPVLTLNPEKTRIPYRIGVVSEDALMAFTDSSTFYFHSRLSKPVQILQTRGQKIRQGIDIQLENIRDYVAHLALETMKRKFTGEKFVRRYLHITYLAESYRVFDIFTKHKKIMEGTAYDFDDDVSIPVRNVMENMIAGSLKGREDIEVLEAGDGFYDTLFRYNGHKSRLTALKELAAYNLNAARISISKNAKTNSAVGANNAGYIARKFGF